MDVGGPQPNSRISLIVIGQAIFEAFRLPYVIRPPSTRGVQASENVDARNVVPCCVRRINVELVRQPINFVHTFVFFFV
jgi:hypothetical protein